MIRVKYRTYILYLFSAKDKICIFQEDMCLRVEEFRKGLWVKKTKKRHLELARRISIPRKYVFTIEV